MTSHLRFSKQILPLILVALIFVINVTVVSAVNCPFPYQSKPTISSPVSSCKCNSTLCKALLGGVGKCSANTIDGFCIQCATSTDCTVEGFVCNTIIKQCVCSDVQCVVDTKNKLILKLYCKDQNSFNTFCIQCRNNTQCSINQVCSPSGQCVQCADNSDCLAYQYCSASNKCVCNSTSCQSAFGVCTNEVCILRSPKYSDILQGWQDVTLRNCQVQTDCQNSLFQSCSSEGICYCDSTKCAAGQSCNLQRRCDSQPTSCSYDFECVPFNKLCQSGVCKSLNEISPQTCLGTDTDVYGQCLRTKQICVNNNCVQPPSSFACTIDIYSLDTGVNSDTEIQLKNVNNLKTLRIFAPTNVD